MKKRTYGKNGKIFAILGMILVGGGLLYVRLTQAVSDPWFNSADYSRDCRFYQNSVKDDGSDCGYYKYVGSSWGWGTWENHRTEYYKHVGKSVFYLGNSSDPAVGTYYYTYDSAVVHCPAGATVEGPHNAHIFASPSLNGKHDGPSHYWCSQNGAGVDPLVGPESGKKVPDFHRTATLTKMANATDVYTFSSNNWTTYTNTLSQNGGYVKCKYTMSGPHGTDNHYHCLSADGSKEADGIYDTDEHILIVATPPDTSPPLLSNVYMTNRTETTATYTWDTNEPADTGAEYGLTNSYGTELPLNATLGVAHSFTLTGLQPGTTYYVKIKSKDAAGNLSYYPSSVATLPPSFNFTLHKAAGIVENKASTRAKSIFKIENTYTAAFDYSISCTANSPVANTNPKTQIVTDTGAFVAAGASASVPPGTAKYFEYSFDIGTATPAGPVNVNCNANRTTATADAKYSSDTITVIAPVTTTSAPVCTLTLKDNKTTYTGSEFVNYTYTCSKAATVTVQVVKPDGVATTYNTGTNVTTNTMGFSVSNLAVGSHTLRICINDALCPAAATVFVPFTVTSTTTPPPPPPGGTGPTVTPVPLTQYGANKYNLKVEDADGIKEFSVKKADGSSLYGGSPGATGNVGACGGVSPFKSLDSGTVDIELNEFPLQAWVLDCNGYGGSNSIFSVPAPGGVVTPPPPPPPPPMEDHIGCDMTIYKLVDGKYVDDKGAVGPSTESLTGTGKFYKWSADHYHLCTSSVTPPPPGPVPPPPLPPGDTTPRACKAGEKCPPKSWCENGQQCYYGTGELLCVPSPMPTYTTGGAMTAPATMMPSPRCPDNTSVCDPSDTNCVAPGQTVPYSSNKWCRNSETYYSKDGKSITCVDWNQTPPDGFSTCRPDDKNCKQKGDIWKDSNSNYYCTNAQKCTNAAGGGSCVGWNESCPAGTKYCSATDLYCVEPGEKKEIKTTTTGGSYWCGGGGVSMIFYSSSEAYCKKKPGVSSTMMWTAADIKATLAELGAGWGLCAPGNANCIEPGKTGSSNGWCAWMPPMSGGYMTPYNGGNVPRKCPLLDDTPTVPPDDEQHKGCLPELYRISPDGRYVDENGKTGPPPVFPKPGYTTEFKKTDDHYHFCIVPEKDKKCLQVITRALNPKTGECRDFPDSCIDEGWVKKDCKIIRECAPGEYSTNLKNECRPVRYKWHYGRKQFEKCSVYESDIFYNRPLEPYAATAAPEISKMAPSTMILPPTLGEYTHCIYMNEGDKSWMVLRALARPPEKFGLDYWPRGDINSRMRQFNLQTNQFEECRPMLMDIMPYPGEYRTYCESVPEEDEGWIAERHRVLFSQSGGGNKPPPPLPPEPEIPPKQCRAYLDVTYFQPLSGYKQFWKNFKHKLASVPADYEGLADIKKLMSDAVQQIKGLDRVIKKTRKCDKAGLIALRELWSKLDLETIPALRSYLAGLEEYAAFGQCYSGLKADAAKLQELRKQAEEESQEEIDDLLSAIEEKLTELSGREGDFDAAFECREFADEVGGQISSLVGREDKDIKKVVEEIILKELRPVVEELKKVSAERKEKVEALLVQVAELQKTVEDLKVAARDVTTKAEELTQQIAVSYKSLNAIDEKFAAQKAEIEVAKTTLIPLVDEAIRAIVDNRCVRGTLQNRVIDEMKVMATVNWVGDRSDELARRLQTFLSACRAKEVDAADVNGLVKGVEDAAEANHESSVALGLTPFADVSTHEWFLSGMICASEKGFMTKGLPGESVLAQDALLMVLRATGNTGFASSKNCSLAATGVKSASEYAICAVAYAKEKGLTLQPDMQKPVERIRIAEWITALVPNLPKRADSNIELFNSFKDISGLGNAQRFVSYLSANEIMSGSLSADGKERYFKPHSSLARSELAVILEKLACAK